MSILKDFVFHSPNSLKEAQALLDKAKAPQLLAGGTFVLNSLKKTAKYPSDVISLKNIPDLKGIEKKGSEIRLGAMTRISELLESQLVAEYFPSLNGAASKLATTPIRHMATLGGNIASRFYWVDLPAVLISLNARLEMTLEGKNKVLSLLEFYSDKPAKNTVLVSVLLPCEKREARYFRHTRTVQEVDVPYLGLASSWLKDKESVKDVRLIVNTTLSFPVSLNRTASLLEGAKAGLDEVRQALMEDAKTTKLDEYRIQLLEADVDSIFASLKK